MEKKGNHPRALFNSFSLMCNLLPYFGYLDQSYKMMSQLNRNSNNRWKDYEAEFCLSLLDDRRRRLSLCFSYSDKLLNWKLKDIVAFLRQYPILYKIFKLPYLNIITAGDLDRLLDFCQGIDNRFLRFTTINFDHVKLETGFHTRYTALLQDQGLEAESAAIHHYISSKGIFLDANNLGDHASTASTVPKTICCIMLSADSTITNEKKEVIDNQILDNIRHLKINFIKEINSYIDFCNQNKKIVDWFKQIDDIKFSVTNVTPACLTNVLLHFNEKIRDSIEVRSNVKANKLQVEAENCYIMVLYVDTETNSSKKQIYKAQKVRYESINDTLDVNQIGCNGYNRDEWTQIKDVASFQVWLDKSEREIDVNKDKYRFIVNTDTSYTATALDSYVLIRKKDITKISVDSGKNPRFYSSYKKAALTIDMSNTQDDHATFAKSIDDFRTISLQNTSGI